jgi:hypothetical protein
MQINEINFAYIDQYDLSFIKLRMREEGCHWEDFEELVREFKRFIKLVMVGEKPLAMVNERIDRLWHTFILFTPQYREFCIRVWGRFIDHQPRTEETPVPLSAIANFFDAYHHEFGQLHPIWRENILAATGDGASDEHASIGLNFRWSGWVPDRT